MSQQTIPNNAPGTRVFPQFALMHGMTSAEVAGLTDRQLDWTSDQWKWSKWSIRRQVSHIISTFSVWLLRRWGSQLFPNGYSELGDLAEYSPAPEGRWLDESKYWNMPTLLGKLDQSMRLVQYILSSETAASMRKKELARPDTQPHWRQFAIAHPDGIRWHSTDPNFSYLTLEATFRHLYFGAITHIYNIQRLKRAQGLTAAVEIPFEGYWALPDWDRSEP